MSELSSLALEGSPSVFLVGGSCELEPNQRPLYLLPIAELTRISHRRLEMGDLQRVKPASGAQ